MPSKTGIPTKPTGTAPVWFFVRSVWECIWQGKFPFLSTDTVQVVWSEGNYSFNAAPARGGGKSGGFDIYDQTKSYAAGETFFVPLATTIAGIAVAAGLYGVPKAGMNSVGTFAGSVPANPTGNAVPQYPLPSIGTAPNDKYYAILISGVCSVL